MASAGQVACNLTSDLEDVGRTYRSFFRDRDKKAKASADEEFRSRPIEANCTSV
jgi:hypothetical protein